MPTGEWWHYGTHASTNTSDRTERSIQENKETSKIQPILGRQVEGKVLSTSKINPNSDVEVKWLKFQQ